MKAVRFFSSVLLALVLLFQSQLVLSARYDFSFSLPYSGEVISGFQPIRLSIRGSIPSNALAFLSMIDSRGVASTMEIESSQKDYYVNLDTREWKDGTYYLFAWVTREGYLLVDSEVISVIIDNRTPSFDLSVSPPLVRSGSEIFFSLQTPLLIERAFVEMENGIRIFLRLKENAETWYGSYLVPYTLNEGTHFVVIEAQDSSGKAFRSSASFMVCNSEPFIVFPRQNMQITRSNISIKGVYKAGKEVFLMLNNEWHGRTTTSYTSEWVFDEVELQTGNNELTVFSSHENAYGPLFPYQKVIVDLKEHSLIVLSYHGIASSGNIYSRSPEKFEQDLIYFSEQNFNIVSPALLLSYFDGKADLPNNPVLITFDDGFIEVYTKAFPLLKKYNVSVLFFVLTSRVGVFQDFVNWEQLSEMQSSRVFSVESHSHNSHFFVNEADGFHAALTSRMPLPDGTLESYGDYRRRVTNDLQRSKELIETRLNKKVHFLSVPFGSANREVNEISIKLGFKATFNSDGGINALPLKPLNIKRTTVLRDDNIEDIVY